MRRRFVHCRLLILLCHIAIFYYASYAYTRRFAPDTIVGSTPLMLRFLRHAAACHTPPCRAEEIEHALYAARAFAHSTA